MHWELFSPNNDNPIQPLEGLPDALLYGYSVYTTLKLPLSEQVIDLHLQRLKKDCKALGLIWRYTDHQILGQLKALFQPQQPVFRLTLIAQVDRYSDFYAPLSADSNVSVSSTASANLLPNRLIVSCRPASSLSSKEGIRLKSVTHQRPMPTIKHGAMTETILHKREAMQAGFDDILLLSANGLVLEASTANLFCIQNGHLRTPDPIRDGCLPGVTRQRVIEAAQAVRIPVDLSPLSLDELLTADGAFLTNAVRGVRPVHSIDHHPVNWSPASQRLMDSLRNSIET